MENESPNEISVKNLFDLKDRVAVITGGAGLLGVKHAEAIAEYGGVPVLVDINGKEAQEYAAKISEKYNVAALGYEADITSPQEISSLLMIILEQFERIDILINNAAHNPQMGCGKDGEQLSRFENFPTDLWESDIAVGLTGAFLTSKIIGTELAKRGKGVILNIASDLGVIAPDQRIYREPSLPDQKQPVKPVTYSVVKHGLIGLTKYLATYWAGSGVRVNAISPGGVYTDQNKTFVKRLTNLIPLGRMAEINEYKGAIVFLCSDASSYMTGANVSIDGGRTVW